ncbi:sensor histidine kinase [Aureisphaera galaxeae]|uniref:ATP-binding protein n=1 Tax=Aureisphaera galaxeae TaxID=1538023 RepID=UPI0023510181|nr:sensor histidine kinase [Aureisphaera galaxeae]MDC8003132.1 sensor histidine kinase [Aureisphaera galaxeae]
MTPRVIRICCVLLLSCHFIWAQEKAAQIDSLHLALQAAKNPTDEATIIRDLAKSYMEVNLDSSIVLYKRLEDIADALKDEEMKARAHFGYAWVYDHKTRFDSVQHYLKLAEPMIDPKEDYDLHSTYLILEGRRALGLAEYEASEEIFLGAINYIESEGNKPDLAICYNNLAVIYDYLGQFEKAINMHILSANIAEEFGDVNGVAKSYNNIGLVHHSLKEYDKAKEYFLKSIALKKEVGNIVGTVSSYHNLGNVYRRHGIKLLSMEKLDTAKMYYQNALRLSEESNYDRGVTISYINLALINTTVEEFDEGIRYGKLALKRAEELNDMNSMMTASINLGDTYQFKKEYEEAEKYLVQGLDIATRIKDVNIRRRTMYLLSRLHQRQGNYKEALSYYKARVALSDSVASVDVKNKVNELETKYQTEKKEKEILTQRAELAEKDLQVRRKNTWIFGGFGLALVLGLLGYLLFNQQKLKNRQLKKEGELKAALAKIETQNKLQEQRLRISRDLHDNIGSQLTFVTSSVDNLKFKMKGGDEKVTEKLGAISEFTTQTIYELRDTIWAMNKTEISFEDLQARIANFMDKAGGASDRVVFNFNVADGISKETELTSIQGMNVYRIIQEAVNNALKYAEASEIDVALSKTNDEEMVVRITDNGKGFDMDTVERGNGLANMKKRARDLNGGVEVTSEVGKGTKVNLQFKYGK